MRVRGQVLGPYDAEQLGKLVRRGQLSRLHELSSDGVNWSRASSYPELFEVPKTVQAPVAVEVKAEPASQAAAPPTLSGKPVDWFYSTNGQETGPVEFSVLRTLAATGKIRSSDLVWSQGMASWVLADQVSGLMPQATPVAAVPVAVGVVSATSEQRMSPALCQAAISARPWVLFIATVLFVLSALSVVGGFLLISLGARGKIPVETATGLFNVVYGVLYFIGGMLLISYSRQLGMLAYSREGAHLEAALNALRSFWVFVSIVLIVFLAFVAVIGIWVYSIGSALVE
jgi:hypothetical protein